MPQQSVLSLGDVCDVPPPMNPSSSGDGGAIAQGTRTSEFVETIDLEEPQSRLLASVSFFDG